MKQSIALMIILLMNIAPATAYQKIVTKEDMKYSTVQPLEASIAIGSPEIANAYKEGEQVKVEDDDIDLIEKHKKIKDELEKDAITITVGDTKEFLIKRDGQESQVQVTLSDIRDRYQAMLPSVTIDPSESAETDKSTKELKEEAKKMPEAKYCANFIIHFQGIKAQQPLPVEPEELTPPKTVYSKEPILQPSPEQLAEKAAMQPGMPTRIKEIEQEDGWKVTDEVSAKEPLEDKIALLPVQPPSYYSDQELCLTEEDTGFLIWVYAINQKKQEVKFAVYADEAYDRETVYSFTEDAEVVAKAEVTKSSPSQIQRRGIGETTKQKEKSRMLGCKVNGKNVEIGARFIEEQEGREVAMYCDPSGKTLEQKEVGDEAQEEYECISGKVEDDRCKGTLTILQRILSLFGLF